MDKRTGSEYTYPVEDRGPAFHGDALEHGEHGVDDVVKAGDAMIGTDPLFQAFCFVDVTLVRTMRTFDEDELSCRWCDRRR